MNIYLQLDANDRLIKVKATGLLSQDLRKRILLAVAEQLRKSSFPNVLIDVTEATFNPEEMMAGAIELTHFMKSLEIMPNVKIAFIYSGADLIGNILKMWLSLVDLTLSITRALRRLCNGSIGKWPIATWDLEWVRRALAPRSREVLSRARKLQV